MSEVSRRGLITGLGALFLCAPAVVRATSLMPVSSLKLKRLYFVVSGYDQFGKEVVEYCEMPSKSDGSLSLPWKTIAEIRGFSIEDMVPSKIDYGESRCVLDEDTYKHPLLLPPTSEYLAEKRLAARIRTLPFGSRIPAVSDDSALSVWR